MGYNLEDHKGANLPVVQFLGWVVCGIVLGAQPDLFPLSELWCTLMVPVIVLGHLLCCMGEGSFGFLLHL